jgi:hypothetical protein
LNKLIFSQSVAVIAVVLVPAETFARSNGVVLTQVLQDGNRTSATVTLPAGWKKTAAKGPASIGLIHSQIKAEAAVEIQEGLTTVQAAADLGKILADGGCQTVMEVLAADKDIGVTHVNISAACPTGLRTRAVFRAFPKGKKAILAGLGVFAGKNPEEIRLVRSLERAVLK